MTIQQSEINQDWNRMLDDAVREGYIIAAENIDDSELYRETCERMEQHYQDLKAEE